jgi:hypothetical protein
VAAFALCVLPAQSAHAQFLFWPHYRSFWSGHSHFGSRHQHRHKRSDVAKNAQPIETSKGPLQVIVSISDQKVALYDDGALIARSSVSTGVRGHPTPLGVFSVIDKQKWHRSNIYSDAPMPYMQRITWSGIALHAGVLPGHPASHGCIRLTNAFAIRLWRLTRRGARVIIAHDEVRPVEVASSRLFVPKPKLAIGSSAIGEGAAAGEGGDVLKVATSHADGVEGESADVAGATSVPAAAPTKVVPISVFVSRKAGRLFVRRAFTPLFDSPVTIEKPEEPLGTHVFTAMELQGDGAALRWTVVSMPQEAARKSARGDADSRAVRGKAHEQRVAGPASDMPSPPAADTALARVDIPKDVVERISELLTPGSSLIVSDHDASHETGAGTDFIVLTH